MKANFFFLAGALVAVTGCGAGVDDETPTPTEHEHADEAHWSYDGDDGPEHWGELSDEWALCSDGTSQSPIDLDGGLQVDDLSDYAFVSASTGVYIVNNGHTIQYDVDPGSSVMIDGVTYDLLQFHFHADSEHTIDGGHSPMEVHFVHADSSGNLAVLGVMIEAGSEEPVLSGALWDSLPAVEDGVTEDAGVTFEPYDMIPGGSTWRYSGSLTTPPCSEGVNWNVFWLPLTLSSSQISVFTTLFDHTYRPVQALNGRTINFGE